ncbi:MAG TPA: TIM barrel protein [Terracidiphilus sp.]|nr:TIM barrel protein [Terracidiphilus sp.]
MDRRMFTKVMAGAAVGAAAATTKLTASDASAAKADNAETPFPLSVMLWTVFRDLPFEERLAKVAEAGYTNIELVGEYSKWGDADFVKAKEAQKRLGIRFDATAGLHHGIADASVRDAFLGELREALKPMETLNCPAMIVLSGNVVPGMTRDEQHAAAIETLKQAAGIVEGKQIDGQPVRLLLECIDPEENPKYFLPSAAEGIEIVRAVNHPQVQFLYDMFHEQIAEGNLIEKLDKHIDVIGLIHIADVPGRHEPGTGEINYVNIYKKLAQLNYKHVVAMEFRPSGDPVATLRAAREMVTRSV